MSVPYEQRAKLAYLVLAYCGLEPTADRVKELAEHAGRTVEEFPPLSDDQRARLAILLRPVERWRGTS